MIEPAAKNFFIRIVWLVILLGALTAMFKVWDLPLRDLSQNEGLYAAVASEIIPYQPMSVAHGVAIKNRFFLYPLISAVLSENFAVDLSASLRYVNFVFIAAIAVLLALIAGRTRDYKAGLVAAAMFCANGFVFMHSMSASPLMMSVFFLFAAQSAWIYCGFTKGQWSWAWIFSLLLLSFGFLTGGFKIIVYFFLPMFFLHRPIKMVSKLNKKGFVLGMIFLGAGIILWLAPIVLHNREYVWDYIPLDYRGMSNFLLNILLSPLYLAFLLLPWTMLVWMPFCVAIRPLDKTPIFSHFFRVIFITSFLVTLFNPFSVMDDFMISLPSLVLLCALTYDTAVRRYSVEMRRVVVLCGYITAILAAVLVIYCFCPYEKLIKYVNFLPLENKDRIFGAILAFLLLSIWIYHYRRQGQIWLIMLLTGTSIGIFCHLTFVPFYVADRSRSSLGGNIRRVIEQDGGGEDAVIYKNNILDLYSESYYMRKDIRKINDFESIDKKAPVIYLLTIGFPQYPERTWKNLFETTYRGQKLYLYRGDIAKRKELINRRNRLFNESGTEK